MIKHVAIFFLGVLLAISAIAQPSRYKDQNAFKAGLFAMPQISYMLNNDDFQSDVFKYGVGRIWSFGMDYEWRARSGPGINLGFIYQPMWQPFTAKYEAPWGLYEFKGEKRNNYIKIPLSAKYTLIPRNWFTPAIFFGPQLGILYDGSGDIVAISETGLIDVVEIDARTEYYNRIMLDIQGGIGIQMRLHELISIEGFFRADYGLFDNEKKDAIYTKYDGHGNIIDEIEIWRYTNPNRGPTHNLNFGISIGAAILFY